MATSESVQARSPSRREPVSAANEFPRLFTVDPLPEGGVRFEIEASERERAGLVRRFELAALDSLAARGAVRHGDLAGVIEVSGRLVASLSQYCVVTLEPLPTRLDVAFSRLFSRSADGAVRDVELDPLAEEPEPLAGATLDIGELVAEELAVALDPYPRAPHASLPGDGDAAAEGPFAALARLRVQ